jgi:hypothetical protein
MDYCLSNRVYLYKFPNFKINFGYLLTVKLIVELPETSQMSENSLSTCTICIQESKMELRFTTSKYKHTNYKHLYLTRMEIKA